MKNPTPELICGIEGGGTRTTWVLMTPAGKPVAQGETTSGNVQLLSQTQIVALFRSIHRQMGSRHSAQVGSVGGAFAGCQLATEQAKVGKVIRSIWPQAKQVVVGEDTRSAYAAAHGTAPGIIVIAGTGSNVQGFNAGRWEKAGGWGHLFADPGSAYDIARTGMQLAYESYDKDRKTTTLGRAFLKATGCKSLEEMVPYLLAHSSKTEVAGFCEVVFAAAAQGDKSARLCIESGAQRLATRVSFVTRRLNLKNPSIGCIGSLLTKNLSYFRLFKKAVTAQIGMNHLFALKVPGSVGAARMVFPGLPL